jgi:UDP-glucose 4-epimerase
MSGVPDGQAWEGARVLITGGLGFLGSNLAIRLAGLGARVTLVDAMIPEYGGNLFNIAPVRDRVIVNFGDVCDRLAMNWLVKGQDYVFHLAGQVSHVMSMTDPFPDIEFNIKGTAVVMEAVRRHNPTATVVFTGTRGQYGPATNLPVAETAPTNPKAIYEVSNLTAEKIIQVYHQTHGIPAVLLRLTNIYGPRAQMKHSQYGVVNWFVRQALDGEPIRVFGSGRIFRDFVYVDDCVDALLVAAACDRAVGEVFNVGWDRPTSFLDLARTLERLCDGCTWHFAPFSPERAAQEPGDFYSDITKIRSVVGWEPRTTLEDGLRQTLAYYRRHRDHYWAAPDWVRAVA